ncbi:MAG: AsmA family protein [Nitrosospira sp.]|nr:AsmA family protein [Nitrosospira sp.]
MRMRSRKILIIFSAMFALVVTTIFLFDWNMLKPYVERQVTEKTGRKFLIQGNLDVSLSLNPRISAEGLSLANADWGSEQPMLGVGKVAFRISLLDLLKGDIVLPEVSISQPKIILEKSEDGMRNWDLKKTEKESELPKIGRLNIDQGTLGFRDPKTETDITVTVSTESTSTDARETPVNVVAEGKFSGLKFSSRIHGGELVSLTDKSRPYPAKGNAQIGTTHAAFDGTITGLETLAAMDMKLEIQGDDLSALYPIVGIVIFPSPPYHIAGRLLHQKTEWSFKEFVGVVGKSDMGGDVLFDTGGKRPMLRADVVSKVLDLEDLNGFMGARRGPMPEDSPAEKQEKKASIEAQRDRMLPDQEFKVDRLRAMDADVRFTGQSIRNKNLPVEHLEAHLKIEDGLLTMDPVNFSVAGGNIITKGTVNARKDIPVAETRIEFRKLRLSKLFPKSETMQSSKGLIGGITQLKGEGKTVGALLASSDGRVGLVMSGGEMSEMVLAGVDLDGGELIKLLFTGDKNVPIRCAVVDFDVKKGLMNSDAFVIDTTETNIVGEGHIRLVDETIKMKLSPQPKDFSILSLRTPVHISGTFKKPRILPDKMLAIRIGSSVLLGVLATPLASLIPLIETGPGEDNDCNALIASVKNPKPPSKKVHKPKKAEAKS